MGLLVLFDQELGGGDIELHLPGSSGDLQLILKDFSQKFLLFLHGRGIPLG